PRSSTTSRRTFSSSSTSRTRQCRRSAPCIAATARARRRSSSKASARHARRRREERLSQYGSRLPSALDNRPLKFDEFESHVANCIYVSATPGDYEVEKAKGTFVEQVI